MKPTNPTPGNAPGLPDETGDERPNPRDMTAQFRLSNKTIVNDDLGVFGQIGKMMIENRSTGEV